MLRKNARFPFTALVVCLFVFVLQACTTLDPDYEDPTVTISSFRALPSEGMVPTFEIGLHILNPNASTFHLEGIVYTVSVQGHDVVKGVGKDFPEIEGYSEQTVKLTATANLFAGVRLIMDLVKSPEEELEYEFEAKLDKGGFGRALRIREKGSFRMNGNQPPQDTGNTESTL
jgi:LEA14-like dessication related protein